jgi:hypothetical protein
MGLNNKKFLQQRHEFHTGPPLKTLAREKHVPLIVSSNNHVPRIFQLGNVCRF